MSLLTPAARGFTAFAGLGASASAAAARQQQIAASSAASMLLRRAYSKDAKAPPKQALSSASSASSATSASSSPIVQRAMSTSTTGRREDKTTAAPGSPAMTADEAMKMLNEQRSLRPTSPHLTIYQPQITWVMSGLTRITGVACSGIFYIWAMSYLALPYTGIGQILSTAHMVQYAALAPVWLKLAIKAPLAFAFSFHSWNGVRHLFWDVGYGLSMKGVYQGGYLVCALSVLTTVGLCMM